MICPYCGNPEQKVLDSRPAREGEAIRRRRECVRCERRFTTFEEYEMPRLFVVKRGGGREEFDRNKLLNSMLIACRKRPISIDTLRTAADHVERDLRHQLIEEVTSTEIGERVLAELRGLDTVAYVRFASVYRDFETLEDFKEVIERLGARMADHHITEEVGSK